MYIATKSTKSLGCKGLLGPHTRLSSLSGTGTLLNCVSVQAGAEDGSTDPLPVRASSTCGVRVCACVQMNLREWVSECGYVCVGICVSTLVSIIITFAVLDPSQEVVRRIESLCPQALPESFLWRVKNWCWRWCVEDWASWLNTTHLHQNPGEAKTKGNIFFKSR